jgi:putative cell wall-binding protein
VTARRSWQLLALALVVLFLSVDVASPGKAANGADFDPGYIISDEQFYDYGSMSASEIQSFLASKVPTCQPERSTGPDDPIELASTIIYKVAQACRINPKVLIVTLQKEQGLVTHTWPSDYRYQKAMGFACPDTAPCDTQYFGFQNQVWRAARQFQRYKANPGNYNYRAGMTNNIYYYPPNQRPECGAGAVFIKNVATASLYNYTPYQPDSAALNNLYTTGGWCSSYGNRNFWRDYTDWFGDPRTGIPAGVTVARVGGNDRYDVAVGISKQYYPSGAPIVYIATGENFPDALGAAPAAAKMGGPMLLVPRNSIPSSVAAELTRLAPSSIVVTGGPASVSDTVLAGLQSYAPSVKRLAGADRYEVSRNVTRDAFLPGGSTLAYLATGATFPDALSASAAAGALGAPVILVPGTNKTLDAATTQLLTDLGVTEIRIAGGPASVSPEIEAAVRALPGVTSVSRLGGADRYQVSGATNRAVFTSADAVFIASGLNFPDALSGAAVAGATDSPLYVVPPECLPSYVIDDVRTMGASQVIILGGPASVSPQAASFVRCR